MRINVKVRALMLPNDVINGLNFYLLGDVAYTTVSTTTTHSEEYVLISTICFKSYILTLHTAKYMKANFWWSQYLSQLNIITFSTL